MEFETIPSFLGRHWMVLNEAREVFRDRYYCALSDKGIAYSVQNAFKGEIPEKGTLRARVSGGGQRAEVGSESCVGDGAGAFLS